MQLTGEKGKRNRRRTTLLAGWERVKSQNTELILDPLSLKATVVVKLCRSVVFQPRRARRRRRHTRCAFFHSQQNRVPLSHFRFHFGFNTLRRHNFPLFPYYIFMERFQKSNELSGIGKNKFNPTAVEIRRDRFTKKIGASPVNCRLRKLVNKTTFSLLSHKNSTKCVGFPCQCDTVESEN